MHRADFKQYYNQYFDPLRSYLYYRSGNQALATDLSQEGRVGVKVPAIGEPYVLAAGERLSMQSGHWQKESNNDEQSLAWLNAQFYFEATPIAVAFAEIERSYAIEIQYQAINQEPKLLNGVFEKMEAPFEILSRQ